MHIYLFILFYLFLQSSTENSRNLKFGGLLLCFPFWEECQFFICAVAKLQPQSEIGLIHSTTSSSNHYYRLQSSK
jgi:hypothetical protein